MPVRTKRIYDPPKKSDGYRVLIDRLWPRGIKKDAARLDAWRKDLAPSTELRQWFDHDPAKFEAFAKRFAAELAGRPGAIEGLLADAGGKTITLLYAAKDTEHNHAVLLRDMLEAQR